MARILYVCQKCGEEVGEGEQDYRNRHAYCGGTIEPIGECMDYDEQVIRDLPTDIPEDDDARLRCEIAMEQLRDENR